MRYNWNPWHGCHKKSAGCLHCYVFAIDGVYEKDASQVHLVKTKFEMPIKRNRQHQWVIPSGSSIATCFTSDFFVEEADVWRPKAWEMMAIRNDCLFFIITKRPERIANTLPDNWNDGYDNVFINVTAENQAMADERIPILLNLPLKMRGIAVAPILEAVDLRSYLKTGNIQAVSVGGESYRNARITRYEEVLDIRQQCMDYQVNFTFHQTGSKLLKDGKLYHIPHHCEYEQARKADIDFLQPKVWHHIAERDLWSDDDATNIPKK
ncbi:MAG: DUF5131 family protein [Bacteroidales bacterium]|nr:DUF5131 family protein [Bacteroidales bacterium]